MNIFDKLFGKQTVFLHPYQKTFAGSYFGLPTSQKYIIFTFKGPIGEDFSQAL